MNRYLITILIVSLNVLYSQPPDWKKVDEAWDDPPTGATHHFEDIKCADSLNCMIWGRSNYANDDYYFRRTTDGGKTWTVVYYSGKSTGLPTIPALRAIAYPDTNLFIAVGEDTVILRTTDKGETWEKIPFDNTRLLGQIKMCDNKNGIAVGVRRKERTAKLIELYKTKDGGVSWEKMIPPKNYTWLDSFFIYDYQMLDKNLMIALVNFYLDINGGLNSLLLSVEGNWDNWQIDSVKNPPGYRLRKMSFIDRNTGWLAYANVDTGLKQLIIKTTDGGKTWSEVRDTNYWACPIYNFQFSDENFGVATTCLGTVLMTHDGGKNWNMEVIDDAPWNPDLGAVQVPSSNTAYVISDTRRIYKYTRGGTVVVELPETRQGIKISPNPATDYMEISYPLSREGAGGVSDIRIYNILGECVLSTPSINANSQEGNFRIDISNLPSGTYYIRLGDLVGSFVKIE